MRSWAPRPPSRKRCGWATCFYCEGKGKIETNGTTPRSAVEREGPEERVASRAGLNRADRASNGERTWIQGSAAQQPGVLLTQTLPQLWRYGVGCGLRGEA
eukprot:4486726-Amphidinium_carterae.1